MKEVIRGSPEWAPIEMRFKLTQPGTTITKIQRIQNRHLWKVFYNEMELVAENCGGVAQTKELFHGTSNTNPELLYNSEEGFDMRFSPGGMWGRANYFAVNSSYSNGYSHRLPSGER